MANNPTQDQVLQAFRDANTSFTTDWSQFTLTASNITSVTADVTVESKTTNWDYFGTKTVSCTFTPPPLNWIVLADGTSIGVDTSGSFMIVDHNDGNGNFTFTDTDGHLQSIARASIKEVHFQSLPSTVPQEIRWGGLLFDGFTNLTVAEVNIPDMTAVGPQFCLQMFGNCENLTTIKIKLPNLVSCMDDCFNNMFYQCSKLEHLPADFDLPQTLTTIGATFCMQMFFGCTLLTSNAPNAPLHFPTGSGGTPSGYAMHCFANSGITGHDTPLPGEIVPIKRG